MIQISLERAVSPSLLLYHRVGLFFFLLLKFEMFTVYYTGVVTAAVVSRGTFIWNAIIV